MEWLFRNWHDFADWAAAQPVVVQIAIGTFVLSLAYAVFVYILAKLTARPPVLPRSHSDTAV